VDIQKLHNDTKEFVENAYAKNTDSDFDIPALGFIVFVDEDKPTGVMMFEGDGNPIDGLSSFLANPPKGAPDIENFSFCTATWRKDDVTHERIGEGVMILTQSESEQLCTMYEVERGPLPFLKAISTSDKPDEMHSRVPLLYKEDRVIN
jgi:hypothetical protein